MAKPLIDADALIAQFENATAQQGEQLRKAVSSATLQALQGRELSLKNIRASLKGVTDAVGAGMAKSGLPAADAEGLLDKAVAGMDDAMLKAVEANRLALGQLVAQGADLRDKHLAKALGDLEKFEDTLMATVRKAASGAGDQLGASWGQVLEKMQAGGTASGSRASATADKLMDDMQAAMRNSRAASLKAAQAMAESYTAMVSGVLLGMSEALQQGGAGKAAAKSRK
ncbi:MAG: hypothetical protein IPI03_02845 [Rubrivivax sp.]|nr:hypothetical protein [Rubrivivax sp.]MBK7260879.1 hypothetical protein [Rubrivivax sp.]MBK8527268.1 hypothetical protein [Rubrivivax sp.]